MGRPQSQPGSEFAAAVIVVIDVTEQLQELQPNGPPPE